MMAFLVMSNKNLEKCTKKIGSQRLSVVDSGTDNLFFTVYSHKMKKGCQVDS